MSITIKVEVKDQPSVNVIEKHPSIIPQVVIIEGKGCYLSNKQVSCIIEIC